MHILLIEDHPGDALLLRRTMAQFAPPHQLDWVEDGDEALEFVFRRERHAGAARPDLVLLDLNLPGKDGFEVLQGIKQDPELSMIPVLILSSSQRPDDISRVYQLGANAYLSKPSDYDEMLHVVQAIAAFWMRLACLPEPSQAAEGTRLTAENGS